MAIPMAIQLALRFAPELAGLLQGKQAEDVVHEVLEKVVGPDRSLKDLEHDGAMQTEFRLALLAQRTRFEELYYAEIANARQRDIEIRKQTGGQNSRADQMVRWAAIGTAGGFVAMLCLGYIKARYPDAVGEGVFGAMLSQLSMITSLFGLCLRDAYQFEFGSSRGSRLKDEAAVETARSPNRV
jgi:hypothetical protein